jgi:sulfoxide reductase heme-binding subunit YedZ
MSVQYKAIYWNPQKRVYDGTIAAGVVSWLVLFVSATGLTNPNATIETLLIRALGTCAFALLHVILSIGPLCRLDARFLPLLYNRRHLGVTMFLLALAHGGFAIVQFHTLGDTSPLMSVLSSNRRFESISQFPFQQLGFAALLILLVMAATSHDFWLRNLTAPVWKRIHMLVYFAYALIVAHVALGALQTEQSLAWALAVALGAGTVISLHITAALRERPADRPARSRANGFIEVCEAAAIPDNRAVVVTVGGERVAVFRYGNCISAVSNVCQHQNGPLGEGRILDGCITCPWHGYQYLADSGAAPPPFTEKIPTFRTRVDQGRVYVHPSPLSAGTRVEPSRIA